MRRAEDPATLGDLHDAMAVVLPALDRILDGMREKAGPEYMRTQLKVITHPGTRRSKRRGQLRLVERAS